ncbi:serine/threonine-protein kinase [Nocardioides allogilvus]|uniref:serine/threonine-protein kinase n=1 Tax=Nocardioides allogilvus TaxID=2072017 RepID=UPI001300796C|nr:serine/threonine-protein kinase [Nocardioides allogilvus]
MSAPSRLGRYPVRRRIGSGAFATVWLAYDEQLDSPVAIKVLADNWTEDFHARQRFVEEGRFLRKVESPHVVSVYDAGELPDSRPYLVMSYADQGSLADRLDLEPLTVSQAVHVIAQVGAGLHALHQRGVLHRDVKPANVLFRTVEVNGAPQVSAMLGDLGLGKAMDMSSRLTIIGGTPSFVSPEQAQGEPLDPRADQFSLAALTYLLLAGRAPYNHASLNAAADPAPPPPLDNGLPAETEAVISKAMAKDREERYADVPAFVAALSTSLAGHTDEPPTWIPVDPDLTLPAPRPGTSGSLDTDWTTQAPSRKPGAPARLSRKRLTAVGLAAVLVGLLSGFGAHELIVTDRTIEDVSGTISVTVPEAWTRAVDTEQWVPPDAEAEQASISAGTAVGWNQNDDPGQGIFLGVLPGELPPVVPQHPECEVTRPAVTDRRNGDSYMTVEFTDCPHGGITIERVIQVTANRLLWVQVRAEDRSAAIEVLDSVKLSL